jgi:hypothetical protein
VVEARGSVLVGPFSHVGFRFGLHADDDEVRSGYDVDVSGQEAVGYWSGAQNRIVLAGRAQLDGGSVRHEMLHALLRVHGHPRAQFLGACAGVVNCEGACVTDDGPMQMPDGGVYPMPEDSLEMGVTVDPPSPSMTQDGGFFDLVVTARNASSRWVTITRAHSARTFGYDLTGSMGGIQGGDISNDTSRVTFAPFETKRQVFDFAIGNDLSALRPSPGVYVVSGGYGSHWVWGLSVTLRP